MKSAKYNISIQALQLMAAQVNNLTQNVLQLENNFSKKKRPFMLSHK